MKSNKIVDNEKLAKLFPTSVFEGENIIEKNVELKHCYVENCVIKSGVKLENVKIKNATIDSFVKTQSIANKKDFDDLVRYDTNVFDDVKVVLCVQNEDDGSYFKRVLEKLHAKVEYICLPDAKFENLAEVCARYVKKLSYNLGFVIGQNAKRIFAVNENGEILNGDEILFLLAWWFGNLNKLESHQVCGTVLTNTGVERKIAALGLQMQRSKVNEKVLKKNMTKTKSKLGALQSGEVFIQTESNKIETNVFLIARILMTIYYENANIWKRVKENKFLQIFKTYNFDEKITDKKALENDLKIIINFYQLKIKGKGRIEFWVEKNKINFLIESTEKTLNFIIFKEINKKIIKFIKK